MVILQNDWQTHLEGEFAKPYYQNLRKFLIAEYRDQVIYPDKYDIYNALHLTPFSSTKVIILGQDPYHGPGQAHGLSFSVKTGVNQPPSLQNIFKELQNDLGYAIPQKGDLTKWTRQGVLLLNTVLTVRQGNPNSHKGMGWESFTNQVITCLNQREEPVVFILWGAHAQAKQPLITSSNHHIIKSPHPSPFSANRGFFGSKPFSKANAFLKNTGSTEIDWQLGDI
ncbi:MAG: uracil-DNA glycosylase [Desulfitobacteriaceae bacterium]